MGFNFSNAIRNPRQQQPGRIPLQPAGGAQPQWGGAGLPRVNTSINAAPIYSQQQTTDATNQAAADFHQAANPAWLMKSYDRPGISRGAQSLSLAMPALADANIGAASVRESLPFSDQLANARHLLAGQSAREDEALGLANVMSRFQDNRNAEIQQRLGPLVSLFSALLG